MDGLKICNEFVNSEDAYIQQPSYFHSDKTDVVGKYPRKIRIIFQPSLHANDLASDNEAAHLEKPKSHKFKFDIGSCNLSRFKEEDVVNSKYQKVIFLWIFRMRLSDKYSQSITNPMLTSGKSWATTFGDFFCLKSVCHQEDKQDNKDIAPEKKVFN